MSKIERVPDNRVKRLSDGRVTIRYNNGIRQYISSSAVPALLAALLVDAGAMKVEAHRVETYGVEDTYDAVCVAGPGGYWVLAVSEDTP